MILEKQTEAIVHQEGESQDSIGMSLDLDSAQILMQMLSKNLYSDAIGSTIRETASNALDAHRRANTDKPIIVSFKINLSTSNYEFSVEDFGIGLDAEDVKNIISKYGKSTKRNSATELGMMGLGFKAPLAYSSSFYFVCRKNGMERKYMMYEGEDVNTIDLLYETPTEEPNGVKVIVPVNYSDRTEFQNKINEQLAYFENVYFDVKDFDNNFSIFRSEHFQWSPLATDKKLHICLDNVYYPIEFDKLGIQRIEFPVALRFSLTDGIFPTPNRESIRYTKEAKSIILNKIACMANYFVEKYNESVKDTSDFKQILEYYSSEARHLKAFGKSLDVAVVKEFASVKIAKPKMEGVEVLNLETICRNKDYILNEYKVKYRLEHGKFKESRRSWQTDIDIREIDTFQHFIFSNKIGGNMKDYLKQTFPSSGGWYSRKMICKKTHNFELCNKDSYNSYYDIIGLSKIPKQDWRKAIQEFQKIQQSLISGFINIDEIVIPKAWLDARKKVKVTAVSNGPRRLKLKGDVIGKKLESLERHVDGKSSKQVSNIYALENAHKIKKLVVYGKAEHFSTMDKLFSVTNKEKMEFVIFSDREIKNFEKINLHNWMPIEKFMEGNNKPFKRLVTAYLIRSLMQKNKYAFERMGHLKNISLDLHDKMMQLYKYKELNFKHGSDEIYEAMLEVARDKKLYDTEIYHVFCEIEKLMQTLPFINTMLRQFSGYGDNKELMSCLIDLFKYHKKRIDWKNYNITIEPTVNESITEEEIEELYIN